MRTSVGLVVLLVASVAWAAGDHETRVVRVAAWGTGATEAIVVEITRSSSQAGGQDTQVWWEIHQPAGTVQATIRAPYSRAPVVKMQPKATLSRESVDKLQSRLAELALQKPAPKQAERWKVLAGEHGLVELAAKACPSGVRVKVGAKRLMLWSGKTGYDLGSSVLENTSCGDIRYSTDSRSDGPDMTPRCFAHAGGYLVRVRLHHGCEGDYYEDRVAYVATP